ncbi:acyl-CoA N-acyltransferase [Phascolomyces articulosus]|uniref:Glucosamine 6-phosphate N-acetyltransferase n=1 Tax=Phascolomyces articulosus TaxID=60185 RepID=A0AAD5JXM0_9FUNG|nr:acyl-CoA N-acyltransferase [Phascolomyces articulosus]
MSNTIERYQNLQIHRAKTLEDKKKCESVRIKVFVEELGYPRELRGLDSRDATAIILLATVDDIKDGVKNTPIGTIRMVPSKDDNHSGTLSRLAVLSQVRGKGIGGKLIHALEVAAKEEGRKAIMLECQAHKRGYYETMGFVLEDDTIHMRVGAPHQQLWKRV